VTPRGDDDAGAAIVGGKTGDGGNGVGAIAFGDLVKTVQEDEGVVVLQVLVELVFRKATGSALAVLQVVEEDAFALLAHRLAEFDEEGKRIAARMLGPT